MISKLTGGDICYGQPVNSIGLLICIVLVIIAWEIWWRFISSK